MIKQTISGVLYVIIILIYVSCADMIKKVSS